MSTEQILCFHGPVRLYSWSESSSQEFKFKVELLDGREALSHFERATRRRGKKAGQRYKAVWQNENGESVIGPGELWLAGANWTHQVGATVAFTPDAEGMAWVRAQRTADVDALVERFFLGLVQLDTDDKPINQAKAALVEWTDGLIGGPKSKAAARRCQESDFQMFVGQRLGMKGPASQDRCDQWIKQQAGIHSKKLLDHLGEAWERYERRVQTPFLTWTQSRGARTAPAEHLENVAVQTDGTLAREPGSDDE